MLPWQHSPRKQCRGLSTNSPVRKLWPHNQPQENQCECPRCQPSPCNQYRRRHSRCSRRIHLVGSTVLMKLSLDSEISRRIGKATGTMSKWTRRAWKNKFLTENAQMHIYQECVLSKLLYGSETWTTYIRQERRLNSFHLLCFCTSSASSGNTTSPTVRYCHVLVSPACTPSSVSAA